MLVICFVKNTATPITEESKVYFSLKRMVEEEYSSLGAVLVVRHRDGLTGTLFSMLTVSGSEERSWKGRNLSERDKAVKHNGLYVSRSLWGDGRGRI